MKSFSIITIPVTPFKQNCSILYDESCKKGVLVDPGGGLQDILQQVKKHNIEIESIWLTHGHIDHIGVAKAASRALKLLYWARIKQMLFCLNHWKIRQKNINFLKK